MPAHWGSLGLRARRPMASHIGGWRRGPPIQPHLTGRPREMLQTVVRESARLGEAFSYARTIVEHDPEGMGAADYRAVAEELLQRWKLPLRAPASALGGRYGDSET